MPLESVEILNQLTKSLEQCKAHVAAGLEDVLGDMAKRMLKAKSVYFFGLGKSGLLATLMASQLSSIGFRSHFIHATDALHGDVGSLREGDVAILVSHSGRTDELVHLQTNLLEKKVFCYGITSDKASVMGIRNKSNLIYLCNSELLPSKLPSNSLIIALTYFQLLLAKIILLGDINVGDCLKKNHPSGALGNISSLL